MREQARIVDYKMNNHDAYEISSNFNAQTKVAMIAHIIMLQSTESLPYQDNVASVRHLDQIDVSHHFLSRAITHFYFQKLQSEYRSELHLRFDKAKLLYSVWH